MIQRVLFTIIAIPMILLLSFMPNNVEAAPHTQAEEVDCVLYPASIADGLVFNGNGDVATSSIYVPNDLERIVSDINVHLTIQHSQYASDVVVELSSNAADAPSTPFVLFNGATLGSVGTGPDWQVFFGAVIDDEASQGLTAATGRPYDQGYQPHGPGTLSSNFDGMRSSGNWQLKVTDPTAGASNHGFLMGWGLEICYQTPPTTLEVTTNLLSPNVHAGRMVEYEVMVKNTGTYMAYDGDMAYNILAPDPTGARVVDMYISNSSFGYSPTGDECSDHGFCNLPDIPSGGQFVAARVVIEIDPDQGGSTLQPQGCAESDNAEIACGQASNPILSDANLSMVKEALVNPIVVHDTNTVLPNDDGAYRIIVQNSGSSDASDVTVVDALPANMVVSNDPTVNRSYATSSGAACTGLNTGSLSCALGTLPAGESVDIYIPVGFSDHSAVCGLNGVLNSASVSYTDSVDGTVTVSASTAVDILCVSDVEMTLSAPQEIKNLGTQYEYTLHIMNVGQSPIVPGILQVTEHLPYELIYRGITDASACGFSTGSAAGIAGPTDLLFTNSVELDVGESCDLVLRVELRSDDATLCEDKVIFNKAEAKVNLSPFDTDESSFLTSFYCEADLQVTKSGPSTVVPGQYGSYVIRVENLGPDPACDLVLEDVAYNFNATTYNISGDFSRYSGSGSSYHRLACMEAGEADTLTLDLYFPPDSQQVQASQAVVNCASATSDILDPDLSNNALPSNPSSNTTRCVQFDFTPVADLQISKRAFVERAGVGDLILYNFEVTNPGPSDLHIDPNTVEPDMFFGIDDALTGPADLIAINSGACEWLGASSAKCWKLTIDAGESMDFWVTARVREDALLDDVVENCVELSGLTGFSDPNLDNNRSCAAVSIIAVADLQIQSFVSPEQVVQAGRPFTYTFFVDNLGLSPARSLVLTDTIFSEGQFFIESVSADRGGSCNSGAAGPVNPYILTCTLDRLEMDERWTLTVRARADSDMDVTNEVRVMGMESDDLAMGNNYATVNIHVSDTSDLELTKELDTLDVIAGQTITWTLRVVNHGPSLAENVVVKDLLPAAFINGNVDLLQDCYTNQPGGNTVIGDPDDPADPLVWTIGNLGVGERRVCQVKGDVHPSFVLDQPNTGGNSEFIANDAVMSSDEYDPDTSNNAASTLDPVYAEADLDIQVSSQPITMTAGERFDYRILVNNIGPSTAENVYLEESLPPEVTFISAQVIGGSSDLCSYLIGAHQVRCNLGHLMPTLTGATPQIELIVTTLVNAGTVAGTITNRVTVQSDTYDPEISNNDSGDVSTAIETASALHIAKRASNLAPKPGETFFYSIDVSNNDSSVAQNVRVTDTLPVGLVYQANTLVPACTHDGSPSGGVVLCPLFSLNPSETRSFELSVRVEENLPNGLELLNLIEAQSDTPPQNVVSDTAVVYSDSAADLMVRKDVEPTSAVAADTPFTYTLYIDNLGPSPAHSVALIDNMLADRAFTILSVNSDRAASCTPATVPPQVTGNPFNLNCVLDADLEPLGRWTVIVEAITDQDTDISNEVQVQANGGPTDPDTNNNFASAFIHVGDVADLSIRQVDSADPVIAGGESYSYTLTILNSGPSPAYNVVVEDSLPAALEIVSLPNGCHAVQSVNAGERTEISCNLGNMAVSASESLVIGVDVNPETMGGTLLNRATVDSDTADSERSNNLATEETQVQTQADLILTKASQPTTVIAGTQFDYYLTVNNLGPSVARNAVMNDILPAGMSFVSAQIPGGTGTECEYILGIHMVTCTFGDLPVAVFGGPEQVEIIITVLVDAQTPAGILNNTASVFSDSSDPETANNQSGNVSTEIETEALLSISTIASNLAPSAGDSYYYSIEVTNHDASVAQNVTVTNTLPSGVVYQSNSLVPICTHDGSLTGGIVSCTPFPLEPGETKSFQISVRVSENIANNTELIELAEATSDTTAPVVVSDTDILYTDTAADLMVRKIVEPAGFVEADRPFTYTLYIDNLGPSPAHRVKLIDDMLSDREFTILSVASSRSSTCTPAAVPVTGTPFNLSCELDADLEPFGRWTMTVTAVTDQETDIDNRVEVYAVDGPVDPYQSNNFAEAFIYVGNVADLGISLSDDIDPVTAGGANFNYTLVISNSGPSPAYEVVVVDTLPAGLDVVTLPDFCSTTQSTGPTSTNSVVTCNLGNLAVDEVVTFDLAVHVASVLEPGVLINQATVEASTHDDERLNNLANEATSVGVEADLVLTKQSQVASVTAGTHFDYRLTVNNLGPATAQNVAVSDPLPTGVNFVSAQVTGGSGNECQYDLGINTVSCALGDLAVGLDPSGGPAQVEILITVEADAQTAAGTLNNRATVYADTADTVPGNDSSSASTTVLAQAGLQIVKTASNPTPVADEVFYYQIEVTNHGPSVAPNVQVVDTLPAVVGYLYDTAPVGQCIEGAGSVSCDLGEMGVNQSLTFKLYVQLATGVTTGERHTNQVELTSDVSSAVNDTADIVVTNAADLKVRAFGQADGTMQAGETVDYTFLVDNFGPGIAHDGVVEVQLASDGTFNFTAPAVGAVVCSPASGTATGSQNLSCALSGDFLPNDQKSFNLAVTAANAQSLNLVADISSASQDPEMESNHAVVKHEISAITDLLVTKSGTNSTNAGSTIQYQITVQNLGPSTAENVTLYDRLPAGIQVTNVSATGGGQCNSGIPGNPAAPLRCGFGRILSGESQQISVDGVVSSDVAVGQILHNDAFASADTYDPFNENDFDTHLTTIDAQADLQIVVGANPMNVGAGALLEYTVMVTNSGPSTAQEVVVEDALPDNVLVLYTSVIDHNGSCTLLPVMPQRVKCDLNAIEVGQSVEVLVVVKVDTDLNIGHLLPNSVDVQSSTGDPTTPNVASVTPVVAEMPALTIEKWTENLTPVAGERLVYHLEVMSHGPSIAQNVVVTDTLPAGMSYVIDSTLCAVVGNSPDQIRCELGDMAVGDVVNFDVVVELDPAMSCGSIALNTATVSAQSLAVAVSASAEVQIDCVSNLRLLMYGNPDQMMEAGELITYTIFVDNMGPSIAHGVVFTNEIVTSGDFVVTDIFASTEGRNASCLQEAPIPVSELLTIQCLLEEPLELFGPLDGSGRWTVQVVIEANETQSINSIGDVSSTNWDLDSSNNCNHADCYDGNADFVAVTTLDSLGDLQVSNTLYPAGAAAVAGGSLSYQVQVFNDGPFAAANGILYIEIPPGTTLNAISASSDVQCTAASPGNNDEQISCHLGNMVSQTSGVVVVTVDIDPNLPDGTILHSDAMVVGDTYDGFNENNLATVRAVVQSSTSLSVEMVAAFNQVAPGESIDYQMRVMNTGLSLAQEVELRAEVAPGVTIQSYAVLNGNGSCGHLGLQLLCGLMDIPAGESRLVTMRLLVDAGTSVATLTSSAYVEDIQGASDSAETLISVNGSADMSIQSSASNLTPQAGDLLVYSLEVTNHGPSIAQDVFVSDSLPPAVSYIQDSLSCGAELQSCGLGDLGVGESRTLEIVVRVNNDANCDSGLQNEATISSSTAEVDASNNIDILNVAVNCQTDLRILAYGPKDGTSSAGDELAYTLVVDNLGPSYAHGVLIESEIVADGPFELVHLNQDRLGNRGTAKCSHEHISTQDSTGISRVAVRCLLNATLEPIGAQSGEGRWMVELVVKANESMTIHNIATVSSSDTEGDSENNVATVEHTLEDVADLEIRMSTPMGHAVAGNMLDYEVTVRNVGPSAAENVLIYDRLPAGVVVYQIESSQGSCLIGVPGSSDHLLTCGLGTLQSQTTATLKIRVKISALIPEETMLSNDAFVLSDVFDPNNGNNFAHALTPVSTESYLLVRKVDGMDPVMAGESLFYAISVHNEGPSTAQNLQFSDILPPEVDFVDAQVGFNQGSCFYNPATHRVRCQVGSLAAGRRSEVIVEVVVKADTPAHSSILNITKWPDTPNLLFAAESDFNEETVIDVQADLSIEMSLSTLRPTTGEDLTYRVEIFNHGPAGAEGVVFSDTLPAGLFYLSDSLACGAGLSNCAVGNLPAGDSVTIEILVQVAQDAPCNGALVNAVTVGATTADSYLSNNSAALHAVPKCGVDLNLIQVGEPNGELMVGEDLIYTLMVDNLGPGYAHDVVLTNELIASGPFELGEVLADFSGERRNASCNVVGPLVVENGHLTVSCELGDLLEPVGGLRRMMPNSRQREAGNGRWIVKLSMSAEQPMSIRNLSSVASSDTDLVPNNNMPTENGQGQALQFTCGSESADLSLHKSLVDEEQSLMAGATIAYNLHYANHTINSARCVSIMETVPPNTTFNVGASSVGWDCVDGAPAGVSCTFDLAVVEGGESGEVLFAVDVVSAFQSADLIPGTAMIETGAIDSNMANNVTTVEVMTQVGLFLPAVLR